MSDSVRPHRRQPTRLPHPWDSPGKNTGVGCHFFLQCMKVKSESEVAQSCPTLSDPWTATYQTPPSMAFSREEDWSGVPLPSLNHRLYLVTKHFHHTHKKNPVPIKPWCPIPPSPQCLPPTNLPSMDLAIFVSSFFCWSCF